jgi:hypothetical protein
MYLLFRTKEASAIVSFLKPEMRKGLKKKVKKKEVRRARR